MYQPSGAVMTLSARPAPPARLGFLPDGIAGTRETLKIMRDLVRASVRNPAQVARFKALSIYQAAGIPGRQYRREAAALQRWVNGNIRYLRDPAGMELVQAPERTLDIGAGDCDDQATLLAALLTATGHKARFVAVGMKGKPISHVLVETLIGPDKWYGAETIIAKPFGWFPPNVTSRLILKI